MKGKTKQKHHLTIVEKKPAILTLLLIAPLLFASAQTDTLYFKSGDVVTGEIKSLAKGVLTVKTDYSDSDFKIEWKEVMHIYSETQLYISLTGGRYYYGWIRSQSDSATSIVSREGKILPVELIDIVYIMPIKRGFKDRFSAGIDVGLSFTRSNHYRQLASNNYIEYKAEKWTSHLNYNILMSVQDQIDPISRSDANLVFNYNIFGSWLLIPSIKYLSNTEQHLQFRWNGQLGVGKFLFRTNSLSWGVKLGINSNREVFTDDTPNNQSWEGLIGSELDLFDMGNLSLYNYLLAYPSITERKRWRIDGKLRFQYDLPLDFYVKLDFSLNYDNISHEGSSKTDFVTTTGFGWEW